jgi:alanyl-tRNA synthetase
MMGSWSINNYFKEQAIELAFELLVEKFGIPSERLYATVYKGNPELNLPPDEVSASVWERIGLKPRQIVFLGEDNFWGPAGDSGPCGPCTEVFYDTGSEYGEEYQPGGHFDTARRYIEIWNAGVFMELNKRPDGTFTRLRFNSVDTGSGVERMTMSLNGLPSVYETDILLPVITAIRQGFAGSDSSEADHRILTDHLRASTFILSEGVVPSNEGRGYVPRRLIRKCVAIATRAGVPTFDFKGVINEIIDGAAVNHRHLAAARDRIVETFDRERRDFERVIGKGLDRLNHLCKEPPFVISGVDAFALSSTYGMPVELIRDFVADKGGRLEEEEFAREFRKHQEISRASGSTEAAFQKAQKWPNPDERFDALASAGEPTEFMGYVQTEGEGRVVALFRDGSPVDVAEEGQYTEVIFDTTPFYAEGGGQVGDQGVIEADGALRFEVEDCIKVGDGYYVHRGIVAEGELRVGQIAHLSVDLERRERIKRNHSATHLLHSALRSVLGEHVKQSGSLVEASRFRFDFQHPARLTPEELLDIERLVNRYIRDNIPRETVSTTYDDAIKQGALAFFGDNYGSTVRLVRFGGASAELCGGTHVDSTGDIGLFRIISEGSVASGVRRIVAATAESALEYTLQREQTLRAVMSRLKVGPDAVIERIEKLVSRTAQTPAGENGHRTRVDIGREARALPNGVRYVVAQLEAGASQLREEALRIIEELKGVACLIGKEEDRVRIIVAVERQLTHVFDADKLLREMMPLINGKGGGKRELAQGGGDKVSGVEDVEREFPIALERRASSAA